MNDLTDNQLEKSLQQTLSLQDNPTEGTVVFLKGPWGSGKTFFWKEVLRTSLGVDDCLSVSLFGVSEVSDLREKLASAIIAGGENEGRWSAIRRIASKIKPSSVLEKLSGLQIKCDLLELISSRYVVCFDDLERLPEATSIEEILGFINYLSEHKTYRCIVIVNEDELKPEHRKGFQRLKEKLGLRTFHLPLNIDLRLKLFLKSKSDANKTSLTSEENGDLIDAILALKTDNLRTIRFILDCYFQLRAVTKKPLPRPLIKFLCVVVNEEAEGKSDRDWDFYTFNPVSIFLRRGKKKDEEAPPDHQGAFYQKYYGEHLPYKPFRCVYDLVKKGAFEADEAISEIFPREREISDAEKLSLEIQETHFFFTDDPQLLTMESNICNMFKRKDLTVGNICVFSRGLTSIGRLLERPELKTLPTGYSDALTNAAGTLEDPDTFAHDLNHGTDTLYQLFIENIDQACRAEATRRRYKMLDEAIASGSTTSLKSELIQTPDFLSQLFTSGRVEKIWKSKTLEQTEIYRLLDICIKAMLARAHEPSVKTELVKLHKFLSEEYQSEKGRVRRLRIYRLIEATGQELPADAPKVVSSK